MSKTVTFEKRGEIAILRIDAPDEPVNTLNPRFSDDFAGGLAQAEGDEGVRAVVVISAKKDNFIAGADIKLLEQLDNAAAGEKASKNGQTAMGLIASFKKPVVAAIHGSCLGGGLELALACHARVASDHPKTKLGLPEVQLGLLPGAGGTQRLPRLIGLQAALDMILTGKQVPAKKAKKLGLVDEVVPAPLLEKAAIELASTLASRPSSKAETPLDRVAGAFRHLFSKGDFQELVLEDNPVGRKVLFDQARKQLLKKTKGNYPAPEKALEAMRIGASNEQKGYEAEARFFGELVVSHEAKQLISIFRAQTALKKDNGVDDASVAPRAVERVGMMGAGLMGAGIAYVTAANAGIPVRLKDRDRESVGAGLAYVRDIVDGRVKRRRMSKRERDELMSSVLPTTDYTGLQSAQVVIEAVFEDLQLKQQILREVEAAGPDDVIFASNTSTIPITRIAEASKHPETVIGMHYFSPVHKMPLLEIIKTDQTADWVTATCVELGKKQGKTVIVVRDGVGFYTSRILGPYMNEAFHVLAEGVRIDKIDRALVDFGFPVGPVKLLDEVGIDVAQKASGVVLEAYGHRLETAGGMDALIADERLGRKSGKGFYLYGDKKGVDESVYQLLELDPRSSLPAEEIARRCTLMMVNEAAHCFGEGILRSARDGDIGAIFGLGFPPFRGGPFRYADTVGIGALVESLRGLQTQLGKRFAPAPVLVDMADRRLSFYAADEAKRAVPGEHGERVVRATA